MCSWTILRQKGMSAGRPVKEIVEERAFVSPSALHPITMPTLPLILQNLGGAHATMRAPPSVGRRRCRAAT